MTTNQSAALNVASLLARLVLAAAFIPLGWGKITTKNQVFSGGDAQILIDLGVAAPSAPPAAPATGPAAAPPIVEQGNDNAGEHASAPATATPPPDAAPTEITVHARALYGTAIKLVKAGWPKSWKPEQIAWLGALTELVGGVSILLGLFSRVWAIGLALSRGFALYLTSWPAITKYSLISLPTAEYNHLIATLAILVLALSVALIGPGAVSLDRAVFRRSVPHIKPLPTPKP